VRSRWAWLALVLTLALSSAACGYQPSRPGIPLADPGKCVPVDIAASSATSALLNDTAQRFNGSAAARLTGGGCAFVRIETVDSPVALRELSGDWPDVVRLGPAPVAWVPGSAMWGELLDVRREQQHLLPIAPAGTPFALSPLVLGIPAPMAAALGYPKRPIPWSELEQLAGDPRGWGAYGHPEWGPFRLGKGNPNWSTPALDQTIAFDTTPALERGARALEHSVVYYSDSTQTYFDNWRRLAAKSTGSALKYLSAVIADERSIAAYNSGHSQSDVSLVDRGPSKTPLPLVAIYPQVGTIESDNPIIVLNASWSSPSSRAGARLFTTFALTHVAQAAVAAAGYRPARGALRADVLSTANGTNAGDQPRAVAPASPLDIEQALTHWQTDRRPAHLLVLFDVSASMGDIFAGGHPNKLTLAKPALAGALDQLAPTDDIGLRVFSTKLANPASPNWLDVVPSGPLATRGPALTRAIAALEPRQGSPLYAATRDAYDAVARAGNAHDINGVVLLTDGYNEDDHDTNLDALLAHLGTSPNIRVFTISYSTESDYSTLSKIAQATNAAVYNARNPLDITDVLSRALANF